MRCFGTKFHRNTYSAPSIPSHWRKSEIVVLERITFDFDNAKSKDVHSKISFIDAHDASDDSVQNLLGFCQIFHQGLLNAFPPLLLVVMNNFPHSSRRAKV